MLCCGERVDGTVIVRTGRRLPGVPPVAGVHGPIAIVRMAVGDAYGAKEWREGEGLDQTAYRIDRITRRHCRTVAEFSFRHAERLGAKVFGGPKYTISPVYEGMLKEELDAAATRYPHVRYEPQLIDATYALLLANPGDALVIPALNRDGDCLSDLVLQMFGSIAGAESLLLSFDESWNLRVVMAEAPHGTAPSLFRKNLANPMAMILAGAALLSYIGDRAAAVAQAIMEAVFEAVSEGSPHRGPERPCHDDRVHGRGHQAHAHEAGELAEASARRAVMGPTSFLLLHTRCYMSRSSALIA
ncbi:MAG: hypothetical protein KatS3mg082_0006 [Nitrospiraceae bacterium]|nr:MAG: hypothetical protein KatS3mg082_0006 [Nitrospiraceae bacterium]